MMSKNPNLDFLLGYFWTRLTFGRVWVNNPISEEEAATVYQMVEKAVGSSNVTRRLRALTKMKPVSFDSYLALHRVTKDRPSYRLDFLTAFLVELEKSGYNVDLCIDKVYRVVLETPDGTVVKGHEYFQHV